MRIVTVSDISNRSASELMGIDDNYLAFCIDEAAAFVKGKLKSGETPIRRDANRETADLLMKGRW